MTRPFHAALTILAAIAWSPLAAQVPSLDKHFLGPDEFFIAAESLSGAFGSVAIARPIIGPTSATRGDVQFLIVASGAGYEAGQLVWTRHYWRSRPAAAGDLSVGARVFCLNRSEGDVYRAPRSRDDAVAEGWWTALLSDTSDLARFEVRAGSHRANVECLRVDATDAAADAPAPPSAGFDSHYLMAAEYFIAPGERSWEWDRVAVGRMVAGPNATSRGRAQFEVVGPSAGYERGERVWTQYYWASRTATPEDLVVGKRVFCLSKDSNAVYRGPRDRDEALNSGWWTLTITDVSNINRREVQGGIYRLGLNCLRVAR